MPAQFSSDSFGPYVPSAKQLGEERVVLKPVAIGGAGADECLLGQDPWSTLLDTRPFQPSPIRVVGLDDGSARAGRSQTGDQVHDAVGGL